VNIYIEKKRMTFSFQILCAFIAFTFLFTSIISPSYAQQTILNLPSPGAMLSMTPAFAPTIIKGITIHPDNPLKFSFIVDSGQNNLQGEQLATESLQLIKYFLASLTVPEKDMWVNLSPYEEGRVIPESFGDTQMGRDLLAQDYVLKQLTASLMYPEKELGEDFWERVYQRAQDEYGTTAIQFNTFNKIWIVPEKAKIYEHENSAFVAESTMEVMLEEDFIALEHNKGNDFFKADSTQEDETHIISGVTSEIIKKIILPEIKREVNEGQVFAKLRQIYNCMVLGAWYKTNLEESLLGQIYVDKRKTKGIDTVDKGVNQKIYNQYLEAFKQGVYNYVKEDYDPVTTQITPRKYFSGGYDNAMISEKLTIESPNVFAVGRMLSASTTAGKKARYQQVDAELGDLGTGSKDSTTLAGLAENQALAASKPPNILKNIGKKVLTALGVSPALFADKAFAGTFNFAADGSRVTVTVEEGDTLGHLVEKFFDAAPDVAAPLINLEAKDITDLTYHEHIKPVVEQIVALNDNLVNADSILTIGMELNFPQQLANPAVKGLLERSGESTSIVKAVQSPDDVVSSIDKATSTIRSTDPDLSENFVEVVNNGDSNILEAKSVLTSPELDPSGSIMRVINDGVTEGSFISGQSPPGPDMLLPAFFQTESSSSFSGPNFFSLDVLKEQYNSMMVELNSAIDSLSSVALTDGWGMTAVVTTGVVILGTYVGSRMLKRTKAKIALRKAEEEAEAEKNRAKNRAEIIANTKKIYDGAQTEIALAKQALQGVESVNIEVMDLTTKAFNLVKNLGEEAKKAKESEEAATAALEASQKAIGMVSLETAEELNDSKLMTETEKGVRAKASKEKKEFIGARQKANAKALEAKEALETARINAEVAAESAKERSSELTDAKNTAFGDVLELEQQQDVVGEALREARAVIAEAEEAMGETERAINETQPNNEEQINAAMAAAQNAAEKVIEAEGVLTNINESAVELNILANNAVESANQALSQLRDESYTILETQEFKALEKSSESAEESRKFAAEAATARKAVAETAQAEAAAATGVNQGAAEKVEANANEKLSEALSAATAAEWASVMAKAALTVVEENVNDKSSLYTPDVFISPPNIVEEPKDESKKSFLSKWKEKKIKAQENQRVQISEGFISLLEIPEQDFNSKIDEIAGMITNSNLSYPEKLNFFERINEIKEKRNSYGEVKALIHEGIKALISSEIKEKLKNAGLDVDDVVSAGDMEALLKSIVETAKNPQGRQAILEAARQINTEIGVTGDEALLTQPEEIGDQALLIQPEEIIEEEIGDQAQLVEPETKRVGGIFLDRELLDLQIERNGSGVPLPISQQNIENLQIEGFLPVITNITPINSVPLMLGMDASEKKYFDEKNIEAKNDSSSHDLSLVLKVVDKFALSRKKYFPGVLVRS